MVKKVFSALKNTGKFAFEHLAVNQVLQQVSDNAIKGIGVKLFGAGKGDEINLAAIISMLKDDKQKEIMESYINYLEKKSIFQCRSFVFTFAVMLEEREKDVINFCNYLFSGYDENAVGDAKFKRMDEISYLCGYTNDSNVKLVMHFYDKFKGYADILDCFNGFGKTVMDELRGNIENKDLPREERRRIAQERRDKRLKELMSKYKK